MAATYSTPDQPDGVYITTTPARMRGPGSTKTCPACGGKGRHYCKPRADRVVEFFGRLLRNTKGRWARRPFVLEPWQEHEIVRPLFGTIEWSSEHELWVRTYRVAWIEIPRKNGKSELAAGFALYLLSADGEEGAEIYGAALDTKQAGKVYEPANRMVELQPALRKRITPYKQTKRMVFHRTGSFYEVVPGDAAGNLGHNPHAGIVDEAQLQPDGKLWGAIRQGMGARTQPLMIALLTAGDDPMSWGAREHDYAVEVAKDPSRDPRWFVYIRGIPAEADWRDERLWAQANPALGRFKTLQSLRDEAKEAEGNLRKQADFRQYHLNQWLQAATRWIDLDRYDEGAGTTLEHQLEHRVCYGGLDLSSTADLTASCLLFPPDGYKAPEDPDHPDDDTSTDPFVALWRFSIPEGALEALNERTMGRADEWRRDGWLTVTSGDVLDYEANRRAWLEDARRFEIRTIGYDPWNATEYVEQRLGQRDGFDVVPIRQGYASLSPPTKELERLIISRRFAHGANPVARWCFGNAVVRKDPAGNIKPDKERSKEKIDAVAAAVNALDQAMRQPAPRRSAYEDRGVIVA